MVLFELRAEGCGLREGSIESNVLQQIIYTLRRCVCACAGEMCLQSVSSQVKSEASAAVAAESESGSRH